MIYSFEKQVIWLICLMVFLNITIMSSFASDEAGNCDKYCLSPALEISEAILKSIFSLENPQLLDVNFSNVNELQDNKLIVNGADIIYNGQRISLFDVTTSLNLLLSNKRFSHFARREKDLVKYAALSKVEELLSQLKETELPEYSDQIDLVIAILHLLPQDAAIVLSGIDTSQQKSITNLTDKEWTNRFRVKRFSLFTGGDMEVAKAWYIKSLETSGKQRQWWQSMARRAMPIGVFNDLFNKDFHQGNSALINQSI